jgi:GT2 family glycosyltransferase
MNVSLVIPTWRGRHLLEEYLPSVLAAANVYRRQSGSEIEIIVVDDAGGDDTASWLGSCYKEKILLKVHSRNQGFSRACQTGFEAARFPIVLLLNNDVRLEPDCVAPLVEHFSDPSVFGVTGKIFNQKGDAFCNGGKIARFRRGMWSAYENYDVAPGSCFNLPLLSFTAIGAFSAFDREKLLDVGGFDPLAAMVEDVELSYRAWKKGWSIRYEPRSIAYHDASQTMDKRYKRGSLDKISRRSRILMHWMLLHDRKMFCRHLAFLSARLLVSWLILDWRFYWAVFTGIANLSVIRDKRRTTRKTMARTDSELLELLNRFYRSAPIVLRKVP